MNLLCTSVSLVHKESYTFIKMHWYKNSLVGKLGYHYLGNLICSTDGTGSVVLVEIDRSPIPIVPLSLLFSGTVVLGVGTSGNKRTCHLPPK